jgi:hypothetical protein
VPATGRGALVRDLPLEDALEIPPFREEVA